jgi:hypothetical protein
MCSASKIYVNDFLFLGIFLTSIWPSLKLPRSTCWPISSHILKIAGLDVRKELEENMLEGQHNG